MFDIAHPLLQLKEQMANGKRKKVQMEPTAIHGDLEQGCQWFIVTGGGKE